MTNSPATGRNTSHLQSNDMPGVRELALISVAAAGLLYFCFFWLAPWIWSQNAPYKPEEFMSWINFWLHDENNRDGIERYVLYAMMFMDLLIVYAVSRMWGRFAGSTSYLLAMLASVSAAFFYYAGFSPPMSDLSLHTLPDIIPKCLIAMAVILPVTVALYYLQQYSARWTLIAVAYLLIPICFISTMPLSWYDTPFIFAPALRLMHGAPVSDIYFQYDLFPSLLALAWLKLRLDPNLFQMVAQYSYYMLFIGLFAFSRTWLLDRRLPAFFLISLVLVRIYSGPYDATNIFQVTPLRLDMWVLLLLAIYFKGPYHWSIGLFCGMMLLLHKNFGIIYSAAYLQLLLTLFLIDIPVADGKLARKILASARIVLEKSWRNLSLILLGVLAHYLIFRNAGGQDDFYFQLLGIGFMRIASNSFYWYVLVLCGLSFALLLKMRSGLPGNYFTAGLALIYLTIGNSLYFFGRSHENNIINISIILVSLLFLSLDMAGRLLSATTDRSQSTFFSRNSSAIFSLLFISLLTLWYGNSIVKKATLQMANIAKWQFIYPQTVPEKTILTIVAQVKEATHDSPNVYFVSDYDFLMEYYGGYAPAGYYNPFDAWISKTRFVKSLQQLADNGYYISIDQEYIDTFLPFIKVTHYKLLGGRIIVWK